MTGLHYQHHHAFHVNALDKRSDDGTCLLAETSDSLEDMRDLLNKSKHIFKRLF